MKKAIIVGASSGIGRELAILLVNTGYFVGVTGRRQELLTELTNLYPGKIIASCFDVANLSANVSGLNRLTAKLGGLNLLVISAGYGDNNPQLNHIIEQQTIDTNVTGFTAVASWAYNYFKHQGSGHIVNISSVGGLRGSSVAPSYSATKAYQINYMEALQQKSIKEKHHINITNVRPSFVDTAMAKAEKKFWISSAKKAAGYILNGIIKQKTVVYVTKRWRLIAALLKLLPRAWYTNL